MVRHPFAVCVSFFVQANGLTEVVARKIRLRGFKEALQLHWQINLNLNFPFEYLLEGFKYSETSKMIGMTAFKSFQLIYYHN